MTDQLAPPRTVIDAVVESLSAIDRHNDHLRAFVRVDHDAALQQANDIDAAVAAGAVLPLAGVTLGVKDNIDLAGFETRAGSDLLRGRVPTTDATVVARLRAAGAVVVGSTNMHEFALGGNSRNPHYGDVRNPLGDDVSPGGSSGGSAAAVAAGLVTAALGTDTCGSVRMPASFTGIVGARPTADLVPLHGVFPLAPTMDTVGPLSRSVALNRLLLEIMGARALPDPVGPTRIIAADVEGVRTEVEDVVAEVVRVLGDARTVAPLDDPKWLVDSVGVAATMLLREAADLHENDLARSPGRYGADVLADLRTGAAISGEAYYEAARHRLDIATRARTSLGEDGVLVLPVFPFGHLPFAAEEVETVPGVRLPRAAAMFRFAAPAAAAGLPAVSFAAGTDAAGYPIGVQLIGAAGAEGRLYALAAEWERSRG